MSNRYNRRLVLEKGGHLFLEYTIYDEATEEHTKLRDELTDVLSPSVLHDLDCDIQNGFTLEDLCVFLNKNLDYWELIVGNCISAYVKQSFETPEPKEDNDTDFLEKCVLKWGMSGTRFDKKDIMTFPMLEFGMKGTSGGKPENFGFGGGSLANIKHLPIEIDKNLIIHTENLDIGRQKKMKEDESLSDYFNRKTFLQKYVPWLGNKIHSKIFFFNQWRSNSKKDYGEMKTSIFQIVYGIFWELSFYGGPEEKAIVFDDLKQRVKDFEESKNEQ